MRNIPILFCALALLCGGCGSLRTTPASPTEIAYKTLATTAHTVDAAMKGWADYVVAGLADPASETHVEEMYENYQRHAKLAAAQASELGMDREAGDVELTLRIVEAAAAQLVVFIRETQKKDKP